MFKKLGVGLLTLMLLVLPLANKAAADTTPTNLIANPSMETSAADGTPAHWHDGSWGTNTHTATYENTGHTGSRSLKVAITSYTNGDAKWYFDEVSVTPGQNYAYSNWYQSSVDSEIDAQVTAADGTITYDFVTTALASPGVWKQAAAQFVAPANAKRVTFFQVLAKVGSVQIDDASLSLYTPAQFNRGIVSLTFDDGWLNQYTAGLSLLDKHNAKATFYIISSTFLDNANYPDYMNQAEIQALQNDGHEIGSHTVTHPHLPTLTATQLDQELGNSKTSLQSAFGLNAAINFATPYGEYNAAVITGIQKYYRSHRSTDDGFNSKDNFDIYNIKVQNVDDATTPAQVAAWVAQAQRDKTWLVLVYHLVQNDPNPAPTEDYSVSPANLEAELANMQQSGIAVETVNQALDEIKAQMSPVPPTIPGDINGDSHVDIYDLSILSTNWQTLSGATKAQGDLNGDGSVDIYDLSILSTNWGK